MRDNGEEEKAAETSALEEGEATIRRALSASKHSQRRAGFLQPGLLAKARPVLLILAVAAAGWFLWRLLGKSPGPDPVAEELVKTKNQAKAERDVLISALTDAARARDSLTGSLSARDSALSGTARDLRRAKAKLDSVARVATENKDTSVTTWETLFQASQYHLASALTLVDSLRKQNDRYRTIVADDSKLIASALSYRKVAEARMDSLETQLSKANRKLRGPRFLGLPLPDACFAGGPTLSTKGISYLGGTVGLCYRIRFHLH